MEKVRPWFGQPSDRGRLKNRTERLDGLANELDKHLGITTGCMLKRLSAYSSTSVPPARCGYYAHSGLVFLQGRPVSVKRDARCVVDEVGGGRRRQKPKEGEILIYCYKFAVVG